MQVLQNEEDKELFSYLLDKKSNIINNIKENILFDYSQLSIKVFIKDLGEEEEEEKTQEEPQKEEEMMMAIKMMMMMMTL